MPYELDEVVAAVDDALAGWEDLADVLLADASTGWDTPTGCPGWSVRDVLAHVVGLESVLLGDPAPDAGELAVGAPPHVRDALGVLMESHVEARRSRDVGDVVAELHDVAARRRAQVRGLTSLDDTLATPFGADQAAGRILPIRVFDLHAHELDVRRALALPWRPDGAALSVLLDRVERGVAHQLSTALTDEDRAVALVATDADWAFTVDLADGSRGGRDAAAIAAATLATTRDGIVALGCGRADAPTDIAVTGDTDLGVRVLADLGFTP
ncbi:MAG: maleylpyruvate isomerase family mycothiol-dependent enzyme [Actinomycetes bacterium]